MLISSFKTYFHPDFKVKMMLNEIKYTKYFLRLGKKFLCFAENTLCGNKILSKKFYLLLKI